MSRIWEISFFRLFCFFEGVIAILIIWLASSYSSINPLFEFSILMAGFGLQAITLFAQIAYVDKKLLIPSDKKTKIMHAIMGTYVFIWVLFSVLSIELHIEFIKESIGYIILSIFIILFELDKILTQSKKSTLFKAYRIWIILESMISLLLGGVLLIMTLVGLANTLFLIFICFSLAASSNILLAIMGVNVIKNKAHPQE